MQNKQHTVINLPTLSVGASCHSGANQPQYTTKSSLFSPYSRTKLYYLSMFHILFIFNPVHIYRKKSLRIEAKTADFAALNRVLRLIFIHIIQSFLYTICTNYTKAHTKKQSRKSREKAFLSTFYFVHSDRFFYTQDKKWYSFTHKNPLQSKIEAHKIFL